MPNQFVRALALNEMPSVGCRVVAVNGSTLALFQHQGKIFAVDNRCPHMGFPLERGTVRDGILTCHWHHARFDLATGGTFDLFADDVPSFPVEIRDDAIWVDVTVRRDAQSYFLRRLNDGLEHELPLVIAKTVIAFDDANAERGLDAVIRRRSRFRHTLSPQWVGTGADDAHLLCEPPALSRRCRPSASDVSRFECRRAIPKECRRVSSLKHCRAAHPILPHSNVGSAVSSRCATAKVRNAVSSPPCARG